LPLDADDLIEPAYVAACLVALGGSLDDVVHTRIHLKDAGQWESVARILGRYLGHIRPANTLIEASDLVGPYELEIEAEAAVTARRQPPHEHAPGA